VPVSERRTDQAHEAGGELMISKSRDIHLLSGAIRG
jgi:hypothetical protein